MNGFEKHGIKYLSHSSVDDFIESQAGWCIKYLGGKKGMIGPSGWRGNAVEAGLAHFAEGHTAEEALAIAYSKFDLETRLAANPPEAEGERRVIPLYLSHAIRWIKTYDMELLDYQIETLADIPDMPLPFKCWIDFKFDKIGCVDLKTRKTLQFKGSDARQLSIYGAATREKQSLLCVTPAKFEIRSYGDNTLTAALDQVREEVLRMERFLSRVENVADALSILSINPENWKVNSNVLDAHAELTRGV